jgi:nicotinate-nucleotide adenylyltransferase
VTPGNPLKDARGLPPTAARVAAARAIARHPRIDVSDIEAQIDTRYSVDTLRWLLRHAPGVHFVWLMGADSLRDFHRWRNWRAIAGLTPMAVLDRGGAKACALASPAAQALRRYRRRETAAHGLYAAKPPVWVFLHGAKSSLSSTALRATFS